MTTNPNICFLNTEGTNCNNDMAVGFEMAGAAKETLHQVHINELRSGAKTLAGNQILILSGGFANGDDVRAGARFGLELREEFADDLNQFVRAGNLVLGVCNGDQVLAETGLIPHGNIEQGRPKSITLTNNDIGKFDCRWGRLAIERETTCQFMNQEILGEMIELSWAHAEGKTIIGREVADYEALARKGQVVMRYASIEGEATQEFPANPNGSQYAIAGLCNEEGNVAGLMPHPERFIFAYQHPEYARNKINGNLIPPAGLPIFKAMLDLAQHL